MSEVPDGNPSTETDPTTPPEQESPPVRYTSGTHPVLANILFPAPDDPSQPTTPAPTPAAPAPDPAAPVTEQILEPTGEWPTPGPEDFAEEDTDPTGFPPLSGASYPPASDPFDDPGFTSAYPLPGWSAPPDLEPPHAGTPGRRPILIGITAFAGLAALIAAFLLVPHGQAALDPAAAQRAPESTTTTGQAANTGPAANTGDRAVTGARNGLETASFDVLDSATLVQLTAADLGDDLFRVSTPANSGLTPSAEQTDGTVKLRLRSDGSGGNGTVTIQLSSAVRWTLRMDGGTAHSRLDLTGADLAAVDLNGGASRIDLALPEPHGLLPVRMSGGVDQFLVNLAGGTPVRVRVQSGAGQVTVGGATHQGIAPGRSFTANDWSGSTGIDLLAVAGLSTLTIADS
ncbi:hypothetical protein [Actinoplanes regularis]|uniref:hypothetical protein n=1 Tax=Actinoplanes regularis TaxID=52697 RepID=UPI0024A0B416|nr:hypothetical protein [Actinoplanes regularis]GLW28492.1 hypothetical protein Areg01_14320 [Actinoplanes regularis]